MIHKLLLYIAFLASVMIAVASPVHAVTTPIFPSCEAPSGTLIAQYDSGTHGIPGRSAAYTGSDAVYELSNSLVHAEERVGDQVQVQRIRVVVVQVAVQK